MQKNIPYVFCLKSNTPSPSFGVVMRLVVALVVAYFMISAWDDFLDELIRRLFNIHHDTLSGRLLRAVVASVVAAGTLLYVQIDRWFDGRFCSVEFHISRYIYKEIYFFDLLTKPVRWLEDRGWWAELRAGPLQWNIRRMQRKRKFSIPERVKATGQDNRAKKTTEKYGVQTYIHLSVGFEVIWLLVCLTLTI